MCGTCEVWGCGSDSKVFFVIFVDDPDAREKTPGKSTGMGEETRGGSNPPLQDPPFTF